jgi:glycosyltransferase involved in cell wall biosynthesis
MKEYDQPFVSVVTPVYNGERFLAECIESIIAQTYQNWEYIIVNNCSTDRTLEIAENYAKKEERIRIYNNDTFLTAIQNFNHSLRLISPESKYCKTCHADDFLFPDCITKMVELAEANPSVGIVGSYRLTGKKVQSDGLPYTRTVLPGHEISRMNLLDGPYTFGTPTAHLIRSDHIRSKEPFYNEDHTGADTESCLELLQNCDFGFVHQVLWYNRVHENSVTSSNFQFNKNIGNFIYSFKKYGPVYLSQQEYDMGLKKKIKEYYRFLGSRVTQFNNKEFWDYHKNVLQKLGYTFSWIKVFQGALFLIFRRMIDTKQNAKSLYCWIKKLAEN